MVNNISWKGKAFTIAELLDPHDVDGSVLQESQEAIKARVKLPRNGPEMVSIQLSQAQERGCSGCAKVATAP